MYVYIYIYIYIYIYSQAHVSSCPGLIRVALVTELRTDVTRVFKAPDAEHSQNAWGEQTKKFVLINVLQTAQ